jgi:hypothetical protein
MHREMNRGVVRDVTSAHIVSPTRAGPIQVGDRFGMLTALMYVGRRQANVRWLFRCDCDREHVALSHNVKRGSTRSCGCRKGGFPPADRTLAWWFGLPTSA